MSQLFFALGSLLGGIGVALGAFGAHALKARLSPGQLETFETGVRYQMFHALGLLAAAFAAAQWPLRSGLANIAGWLFFAGILLFSVSLYLLAVTGIRRFGAITPFGGLAFIAGWIFLFLAAI